MKNILAIFNISSKITIDNRLMYKKTFGELEFTDTVNKYIFLKWIYSDINDDSLFLTRKYDLANDLIKQIENNISNKKQNIESVLMYNKLFNMKGSNIIC